MQTLDSIKELISQVKYSNYQFNVSVYKEVPTLQITFEDADTITGNIETQYCRKWSLQYAMCDSEVVRTAYKAAHMAVLHELDEKFKFKGVSIYNPHTDVHKLVEMRRTYDSIDIRDKTKLKAS